MKTMLTRGKGSTSCPFPAPTRFSRNVSRSWSLEQDSDTLPGETPCEVLAFLPGRALIVVHLNLLKNYFIDKMSGANELKQAQK